MSFKLVFLKISRFSLAFTLLQFPLLQLSFLQAQEVCPLINCDCESIPKPSWQGACINYERVIKLECVQNQNTPKDYCALHGPAGFPLPLLSTAIDPAISNDIKLSDVTRDVDTAYWSINTDFEFIEYNVTNDTLKQAFEGLKNLDRNLMTLLKAQSTVSNILSKKPNKMSSDAKRQWKKYAEKNSDIHKQSQLLNEMLENKFVAEDFETSKKQKMHHALLVRSLRVSGKAHELSGLALGHTKDQITASKHWVEASKIAQQLLDLEESLNGKEQHLQYYRILAASRLQRASYHQLLKNEVANAEEFLDQSLSLNPVPIFEQNLLTSKL